MADRTVKVILRGEVADFTAKMALAGRSMQQSLGKATDYASKHEQSLNKVANGAGAVGVAAGIAFGVAVKRAADFDAAMSSVQAATHASGQEMSRLRDLAVQTGADTQFSAVEAADGIEQLAKAGVSTADIMGGGLAGALDLAAAGQIGVGEAAETAATALTQFNLSGEDVPHVADLLAAAAGKAQGEVGDMAMALKQGGLVAAQMGVSIEETTGSLAAFASAGLLGSDAGTSLKTMLLRLANPSAEAARTMDELGISAYDAQGNFVGMESIAGQLQVAFRGQSQAQRDAALATIFGSDAIRAASILYNQGADGIASWIAKVNDQGYAAETAAIKTDDLRGDIERLGGALDKLLISGGEGQTGFLRWIVQGATAAVDALYSLPGPVKTATVGLLGLTALGGGAVFLGGKFLTGIADAKLALADLGLHAGRAQTALRGLGVGVAIAGVALGLDAVLDKLDEISSLSLDDNLTRAAENLAATGRAVGTLADTYGKDLQGLNRDLDELDNNAGQFIDTIFGWAPGTTSLARAKDNFAELDAVLTAMVEGGRVDEAQAVFDKLAAAAEAGGNSVGMLRGQLPEYSTALETAQANAREAADGQSAFAGAARGSSKALGTAAQAAADFAAELQQLNAVLTGRANFRDFEAAIDEATASIRQNGRTLDITTSKGRANQAALDGIASSALAVAENMGQANRVKFLAGARRDLTQAAQAMGMTSGQAQRLADRLLGVPKNVPVKVTERGAKETERKASDVAKALFGIPDSTVPRISERGARDTERAADRVRAALFGIPDQTVPGITARDNASGTINSVRGNLRDLDGDTATTTVTTIHRQVQEWITRGRPQPGANSVLQADGGVVDYFAGGTEHHVAQIAPAGAWRVWAEPETGGEAYIPLATSKRERSLDIWTEVGKRLGVTFQSFADGALTPGGLGRAINVMQPISISEVNKQRREAAQAAREVDRAEAALARARRQKGKGAAQAVAQAERQLERAREKSTRQTEEARAAMDALTERGRQYRDTILGIGSAFGGAGESTSAQGLLAKLTSAGTQGEEFASLITSLRRRKVDEDIVTQLLQQGATGEGLSLARSLAGATQAELARINQAQRRLERAATSVGVLAGTPGQGVGVTNNFNGQIIVPSIDKLARELTARQRQALARARRP